MDSFLHQASFSTGYGCYDRHRSVRWVICIGLAIDQIAQSGLSSLKVIYYSAQLFSLHIRAKREFNFESQLEASKDPRISNHIYHLIPFKYIAVSYSSSSIEYMANTTYKIT